MIGLSGMCVSNKTFCSKTSFVFKFSNFFSSTLLYNNSVNSSGEYIDLLSGCSSGLLTQPGGGEGGGEMMYVVP